MMAKRTSNVETIEIFDGQEETTANDLEDDIIVSKSKNNKQETGTSESINMDPSVPPAPKVRARKSVARKLPTKEATKPSLPTMGVYTAQLNIFHKQMKNDWDMKALKELKQFSGTESDSQESADCDISSTTVKQPQEVPFRSPSPPPVTVNADQSRKRTTASHPLLKKIEETHQSYLAQKAIDVLKGHVDELVDLSADDEQINSQECICEEDEQDKEKNRSIAVRVMWKNQITKFTMLNKENFSKLISELARKSDIQETQVFLTLNDLVIKSYDTPMSVRLGVADIIEFGILSEGAEAFQSTERDNPNLIHLKVQTKTSKTKIDITMNKNDPMSKLMEEVAKRLGSDVSKLAFKFDGEEIEADSMPEDLDLEDGYCIDVVQT